MEPTCADLADICEGVAFIGETLGPLFAHDPADEEVAGLYDALAALDPAAAGEEWPLGDAAGATRALAEMARGLADGANDALVWEYRRLFVGPGPKAAPPWGSVYTDRDAVVFGAATLALRQWMREGGVERVGAESEPEDHVGTMLLLMAWLARHRPELLDAFLAEHLLPWAPHFLGIVETASDHPFYRGLAALTRTSLEGVRAARGLAVEEPRFYR